MTRLVWARVDPFDKEAAVAALEAGVTTIMVPEEARPVVSALGRVTVVSPGGDLREGRDFRAVEMTEPFLPAKQPRYAMGLGTPAQLHGPQPA